MIMNSGNSALFGKFAESVYNNVFQNFIDKLSLCIRSKLSVWLVG